MSFFFQSAGKQFTQSAGKQRDSGTFGGVAECSQHFTINKPTREELFNEVLDAGGFKLSFGIFPENPFLPGYVNDLGLLVGASFQETRQIYHDTWNYSQTAGSIYYEYQANWNDAPVLTPGATRTASDPSVLPESAVAFGFLLSSFQGQSSPRNFDAIPPGSSYNNSSADIINKINAQDAASFGHVSCYLKLPRLASTPGDFTQRNEQHIARRARFRCAWQAGEAWRASGRVAEIIAYREFLGETVPQLTGYAFSDLRVVERFQVLPFAWNDVRGPLEDNPSAPVENTFSFVVHTETPEQWMARTGIQLAGV